MKRLILITFFLFSFISFKCSVKDTSKLFLNIHSNIKEELTSNLFKSFVDRKFENLMMFLNLNVEFVFKDKSGEIYYDRVTDLGAISNLNHMFGSSTYDRIKLKIGKNDNDDDTFLIEIFFLEGYETADLKVFFVLNKNNAIKIIIIE